MKEGKMMQKNSKLISKNLSAAFKPVFFGEFEINARAIPIENIEVGFDSTIAKILERAKCGLPRKLDNLTWCKMPVK